MTYVPQNSLNCRNVAQPYALTLIAHKQVSDQTATVGNLVKISTTTLNWFGNFTPIVFNDVITLPSGYKYYIESSIQAYETSTYDYNEYTSVRHYNETSSNFVGTTGSVITFHAEEDLLWSRDSVARTSLDCTSSSIDISLRITENVGHTRINYSLDQEKYAGVGRTLIWQLNL